MNTYDVYEQPGCWWIQQLRRKYKSAVHAQKAIDRREKKAAIGKGISIAATTWHTTTWIGAAVVKVITDTETK